MHLVEQKTEVLKGDKAVETLFHVFQLKGRILARQCRGFHFLTFDRACGQASHKAGLHRQEQEQSGQGREGGGSHHSAPINGFFPKEQGETER